MTGVSFYASGLKFTCKRCSSCCRYDPGFVYLSLNDLEGLITELKMDKKRFIKTYCRWIVNSRGDEVLSLKEKSNKDCILWNDGCLVYKNRPLQCRSFPFWQSIVSSSKAWNITATGCPGMNNGDIVTPEKISEYLKMRVDEPIINKSRGLL